MSSNNFLKKQTPLMKQYYNIKKKYLDSILLFRMGDFYEAFDSDAIKMSNILGITLTKRSNGAASDVDLAGFPYHSLDNYLIKLSNAGMKIAICEQVEDAKDSIGIVKREVVDVITPGTSIVFDTNDNKNNFLGCIHKKKDIFGLSLIDISTGEFLIVQGLEVEIMETYFKFNPSEIIFSDKIKINNIPWINKINPFKSKMDNWIFDYELSYNALIDHFKISSLKSFGCDKMNVGIISAGVIIRYLTNNNFNQIKHISRLKPYTIEDKMVLDDFTIKNLELFKTNSSMQLGSFFSIIDKTITPGGSRLLQQKINSPSINIKFLDDKLNLVESFLQNENYANEMRLILKKSSDLERILGKIAKNKSNPRDLLSLRNTLSNVKILKTKLLSSNSKFQKKISEKFIDTNKIEKKIQSNISENSSANIINGNVVLDGVNQELDELRKISNSSKETLLKIEDRERKITQINSLKIRYNKVFGYYIEISKAHKNKILPENYVRKQTLINAERYVTKELKDYEEKILSSDQRIFEIEKKIFKKISNFILENSSIIQINSQIINDLDVYLSFASIAKENNYVKPTLTNNQIIEIKDSRHAVIEQIISGDKKFISNDLFLSSDESQIHIITGPNMAGKSTFLRQIGLIVIMAQIGCYVPASIAKIGIVDKLFTRVGASDNLLEGESTFMVEMIEAANILNNTTKKSLILFDEIGRGTSTYDGLSIAWSIVEYLHNNKKLQSRTIFATHYHELTELQNKLDRVFNFNISVKEIDEQIIFLRKINQGSSDRSYGINVAHMAGIPAEVVERSHQILNQLINKNSLDTNSIQENNITFEKKKSIEYKILSELKKINPDKLSPIEALNLIYSIKKNFE